MNNVEGEDISILQDLASTHTKDFCLLPESNVNSLSLKGCLWGNMIRLLGLRRGGGDEWGTGVHQVPTATTRGR